jgi:hypothetical protein
LDGPNATGESDEEIFNSYIIENEHETNLQDDINRMFRQDFLYRPGRGEKARKETSVYPRQVCDGTN